MAMKESAIYWQLAQMSVAITCRKKSTVLVSHSGSNFKKQLSFSKVREPAEVASLVYLYCGYVQRSFAGGMIAAGSHIMTTLHR